jgi:cobalt transporter subunit CbtB
MRGGRIEDLTMTSQVSSQQTLQVKSSTSVLAQSIAALVFGLVILFAVGFAPMGVAHNAAHDVRHSLAFPCH